MVGSPFQGREYEINDTWHKLGWPAEIGWQEVSKFASGWEPYEDFKVAGKDWQINFCAQEWSTLGWDTDNQLAEITIRPPSIAIYVQAYGDSSGQRIDDGMRKAGVLSGLINLSVGRGYPVLTQLQSGPYFKDMPETIKLFRARQRLEIKGLTREDLDTALESLAGHPITALPDNLTLALRWYGKGVSDESPVDKFISLYESCLAVIGPWHYLMHPDAYVDQNNPTRGRDVPPRRMFGDWVRDELKPVDKSQEDRAFEPYHRIVDARNRVLKGRTMDLEDEDLPSAVYCSVQLLNWRLRQWETTNNA